MFHLCQVSLTESKLFRFRSVSRREVASSRGASRHLDHICPPAQVGYMHPITGGLLVTFGYLLLVSVTVTGGSDPVDGVYTVGPDTSCIVMEMDLEGRLSPLDSLSFPVADGSVKICYGRPSARGRTMIGGRDVPYGRLWRTGANEPTMVHTTIPIRMAGIAVPVGSYSLYTIPGEDQWRVIINRSITQWGHIAAYDYKVRREELGYATVVRERPEKRVETLTFRTEPGDDDEVVLVLEWEQTLIRIPIVANQS